MREVTLNTERQAIRQAAGALTNLYDSPILVDSERRMATALSRLLCTIVPCEVETDPVPTDRRAVWDRVTEALSAMRPLSDSRLLDPVEQRAIVRASALLRRAAAQSPAWPERSVS